MQRYHVVSKDDIEKIHETSLRIMKEVGIVFAYAPAREVLAKGGAKVDGETVYFPTGMVEPIIKQAPSSFTLYARNPARNVTINTEDTRFLAPNNVTFVTDLDKGRRESVKEDFIKLLKIFHMLEHIDVVRQSCEMGDVAENMRYLEALYNLMKYSDKPTMPVPLGYEQAKNCIEMMAMPHGGLEAVRNKPILLALPCTITPLSYPEKTIGTMMAYAEYGQPQMVNALCMAGATSPATIAGTIAVQNAELLAGIVLTQLLNPGTPVIYSASASNFDMRTGSLTIGSPEAALFSLINGQLAKFYNLPCRNSGNISDSKCVDAQAGYESMMNLMTAQMAGGNVINHGCGMMDSYNCVSFEKVIVDHEILGMVKRIGRGITVNEETLAFDVVKKVGPKGGFLTNKHTVSHFRKEFYQPFISDRDNAYTWEKNGSLTVEQRANRRWKMMLEVYEQPDFPAELDADLKKFLENKGGRV